MEWIFDGIGTALVVLILGGVGGALYYRSKSKTSYKQKQKGSHNNQAGRDINNGG